MTEHQNKPTISFNFENEFGDKFSATTTAEVFNEDIDFIGEQLNTFLRQCGYIRNNNLIFMEDINEEEYEALADYLVEFRQREERGSDEG